MVEFEKISLLAKKLNKAIAFYDLETTTFRGRSNFGITDVHIVLVPVEGPWLELGGLINPENAISVEAQNITKITPKIVKSQDNWGFLYAKTFETLVSNCWIAGFKNNSYDNHALVDEGVRYGVPITLAKNSIDVRKLYHKLMPTDSQKGTLLELAQRCKLAIPKNLHRSKPDVILTIGILNYLLTVHGIDKVYSAIVGEKLLTAKEIAKYVKSRENISFKQVCQYFKDFSVLDLLFQIGEAIDEKLIVPTVFANSHTQRQLQSVLGSKFPRNSHVDLKEIKDFLKKDYDLVVDFVQLRIFLISQQVTWPSLKSS